MAEADYRLRDRPVVPPKPAAGGVAFTGKAADLVESFYRARRLRDDAFGPIASQFREPTWDILLDLYLAAAKGRPVSVSSACIGSGAPQTTAIRHLALLESAGLVVRTPNPMDNRAGIVTLTEEAIRRVDDWARRVRSVWKAETPLPGDPVV
ncbi:MULTISPECIES: winged helix DNA-binding protein [unclassified Sphingomonas]|jgi:DNA-binding MarR family transcriptional regulator|uniref:winged helix DNA-binding protein n=1 Tax=unclassified Sphingomonas TaxID=196159 RepID=UPI000A6720B5|nr:MULTISPECIES: winged helix DNA-binding protein [unclassified Sphingomonas]